MEKAVEATKEGFFAYINKNGDYKAELVRFLQHAEQRAKINLHKQQQGKRVYTLDNIVGECQQMRDLKQLLQTVAPTDARVLILGESGTGKELAAGALHSSSNRRNGSYVRINCAAIPETLLESELFGHEKGAFTGALKQKPGRVEEADGGTVFLDEIADMTRPLQAKLLRFLEDGTFTRVGGTQELHVNVRLLAATNRDIAEAIENDEFREDLFHRLNVVQLWMPPLRERGEDILLLANHFLNYFSKAMCKSVQGIANTARQKLALHHWPGNVRTLRNVIERAVILETTSEIQFGSLPDFENQQQPHREVAVASQVGRRPMSPNATISTSHLHVAANAAWKESEILLVREELDKYEDAYQQCKSSGIGSPKLTDIGKQFGTRQNSTHTEVSNFFSDKSNRLGLKGDVRVAIIKWLLRTNPQLWLGLRTIASVSKLT